MSDAIIRDARFEDAERLVEIYSYYVENTAITFEYETPSLSGFQSRMEHTMEKYPYIVIENDGKVEGYAYAGPFAGGRAAYDWSCELTVYLDHEAQKCGYGRKIYTALEEKLKRMGIQNLYACIACTNAEDEYLSNNSAEFHAHLGFKEVGRFRKCGYKFGRWYDMIWMEKIIGEHEEKPIAFPLKKLYNIKDRKII
ncbi:MAG: N-acetyltransferase family protein [Oscillospiraceae bacterium]|nr:N-acetyltransferase family protein [Oscillospiraceae bacterium]